MFKLQAEVVIVVLMTNIMLFKLETCFMYFEVLRLKKLMTL
jgi:hypothetical protein